MAVRKIDRRLTWNDYVELDKSKMSPLQANTEAKWSYSFKFNDKKLVLDIVLDLVPSKTWVVKSAKTDLLLAHEQGHFMIVGLCAREFELRAMAAGISEGDKADSQLSDIADKVRFECQDLQDDYDTMTDFGGKAAAQQRASGQLRTQITSPKGSSRNLKFQ